MNVMMLTQSALLLTTESVVTQMVLTVVTAYQVMLRVFPMAYVEVIIYLVYSNRTQAKINLFTVLLSYDFLVKIAHVHI